MTEASEVVALTRAQLNEALAQTWDAAIASLRYADGSPVEVMTNTNPYRTTK